MIFTLLLLLLTGLSFILQAFIPDFPWAWNSYVFLIAIVFFACAISVPFPVMLMFAWVSGFLYDMMYQIPVKILLFNNGFLGMVRQWQELFYENRFSQSTMNYNPDFVKICSGYDIPAKRIEKQSELSSGMDFLVNSKTAALLEVTIPEAEKVYPMIASGARYDQMVDFNTKKEKGSEMKVHLNRPEKSGSR